MTEEFVIRHDCRFYRGDKPCRPGKICSGCRDFAPIGDRLLVVKLAAAGDVLRTTPLLRALKAKHPRSWITWVTDAESRVLLEGNPMIDELLVFDPVSLLQLSVREFEWAAVLDKEPRAAALGALVKAGTKVGFGLDASGRLVSLNPESGYALRLGLDDRLKFRENRKTYPEMLFGMCGFPYRGEEYIYNLLPGAAEVGAAVLEQSGWRSGRLTVGLNTGAGRVFATKKWTEEGFAALAEGLVRELDAQVVLLGGPEERERNKRLRERIRVPVIYPGVDNSLEVFSGIIAGCQVVVTADTLALHLAVGLGKEVVLLMGPTAPAEIELYGRGEILMAGRACAPCYRTSCPEGTPCMSSIGSEEVLAAVKRRMGLLERGGEKV